MAYYKFLTVDGRGPSSNVRWHLPEHGQPGEWMPAITGDIVLCENGYHACREQDLLYWLNASLYELAFDGEVAEGDDKVVGRKARLLRRIDTWNARTALLFAADCAEHVLPLWRHPDDPRPRQAAASLRARAATADAWDAAQDAAQDAAVAAAWAATGDATGDAARAAAWDAERAWQQQRLMAYLRGEVQP